MEKYYYRDEAGEHVYHRPRRHFRWGRGLGGIILLVLSLSLLWTAFVVQTYLGLTGDVQVARVHATSVANMPHTMFVDLILYDKGGHQVPIRPISSRVTNGCSRAISSSSRRG